MYTNCATYARYSYLGLGVDLCLVLKQEVDHLDVAIVTGHVKRSVTQLRREVDDTIRDT